MDKPDVNPVKTSDGEQKENLNAKIENLKELISKLLAC